MEPHLTAELEENYDRFVERALNGGSVWALENDEGLLSVTAHNGEQAIVPFWSDAAYARRALEDAPPNGYTVNAVPLEKFLRETLGNFQYDDVLVGPNYTRDMAGLELDPREVFEEFRSRMTEPQRVQYRESLQSASILTIGHPIEKLERRVERFGRIVVFDPDASPSILTRGDDPLRVDVRSKPGSWFVPLWSSADAAERTRRYSYASDEAIQVTEVDLEAFLSSAEREDWQIGVDPTIGLACLEVGAATVVASLTAAEEEADNEESDVER